MWWIDPADLKFLKSFHSRRSKKYIFYYFAHDFATCKWVCVCVYVCWGDSNIKRWYVVGTWIYVSDVATFRNPSKRFTFPFPLTQIYIFLLCSVYPRVCCLGFSENYAYWRNFSDIYWIKYLNGIFSFVTFIYVYV